MDEDTTLIELDPDPTPTFDVFSLMSLQLNRKIQALRTAATQVHSLTPVACGYLALALGEVITVATDLHTFLTMLANPGRPQT